MSQNFSSLLSELSGEEIFHLIHEEVARNPNVLNDSKDGISNFLSLYTKNPYPIHFLYAIDPHDLLNFCFPFGFRHQNSIPGEELDKLSDRQTAWDRFFQSVPFLILMDEHRNEFGRTRNRLVRDMRSNIDEFEEFEKLVTSIYGKEELTNTKIEELKVEIFERRLSWLVSAATGELQKAPERFKSILRKLFINSSQDISLAAPWIKSKDVQDHQDEILNIFDSVKPSRLSTERYQTHLKRYEDKNVEMDDLRQSNLLTDHKVADRILLINKQLEEKQDKLQCRYVLLYLSSDQKSKYLSRIINDNSFRLLGRKFSIMRNVGQLWLYGLLAVKESENEKVDVFRTDTLQNLIMTYNTVGHGVNYTDQEMINKITELRDRFEWYGLIKNITQYPDKLKVIFEQLKERSSFEPLQEAFGQLIETLENTSAKESLRSFEQEIRNYSIQLTVFQKIMLVLKRDVAPEITIQGHVVGVNHHLPTLFKKSIYGSEYYASIKKIADIILMYGREYNFDKDLKLLAGKIKDILVNDQIPDIQDPDTEENEKFEIKHYERQSMLYLFALLLPAENIVTDKSDNETKNNLDSELDEMMLYDIESIRRRLDTLDLENDIDRIKPLQNIISNLYYIRIWSLRRSGLFDECNECIKNASEFLKDNSINEDIRLIHGVALLSYSEMMEKLKKTKVKAGYYEADETLHKYLKQAEKDSRSVVASFEAKTSLIEFEILPYNKAHSAMLNTLLYIYVLGYSTTKENIYINRARDLYDNTIRLRFHADTSDNPEFLHTLAYLEYFEACFLFKKDISTAKIKAETALKTIEHCISMDRRFFPKKKDDEDYIELRKIIMEFKEEHFSIEEI